jgi:phosphatidylserine/phosphatidylglycerophosphate/cardiolipin synthase-like enzyme
MRLARLAPIVLIACASHAPAAPITPHASRAVVELAESVPLETTLDHAEIPNAPDVWLDMIKAATHTIDLAEFYVSDDPNSKSSRLRAVLDEVERAAARGVHVRLLCDETFYAKYPEIPDAWSHRANMEMRRYDLRPGVLHAKYFIVDDRDAYLGSQNFDWRSLEHIVEMGVRIDTPRVVADLAAIFRADWNAAGGAPFHLDAMPLEDQVDGGDVIFGASPKKLVPESMWDLPRLVKWIGDTTGTLRIQTLTYKTKNRDGSEFHDLDDAVRAAAARGVHVKLLVSEWNAKDAAVISLGHVANVEARALVIPPFSGGEIPFARVAHAKYALFDEGRAWVGTSNWEGDYFFASRNVGVFLEHVGDIGALARAFEDEWSGKYARKIE